MHELALAEEMVNMAKEKAMGRKVVAVDIEAGALSGTVPDSLEFCAKTLFEESFGPETQVHVHPTPALALCQCGTEYPLSQAFTPCPVCAGFSRKLLSGREVFLRSIEVED